MIQYLRKCRFLFACLPFFLMLFLISSCQPKTDMSATTFAVHWRSLEEGLQEASQRNMPVLVDFFYGMECIRCQKVQNDIYDNSDIVEKIEKDFIPVRVSLSKDLSKQEMALSRKLNNNGECILAFLDSNGRVVKDVKGTDISSMGMLPANDYLRYMDEAVKIIGAAN